MRQSSLDGVGDRIGVSQKVALVMLGPLFEIREKARDVRPVFVGVLQEVVDGKVSGLQFAVAEEIGSDALPGV